MSKRKPVVPINIVMTDIITPKLCSIYITELIKFLVYNKQQIPYQYERLKMFVTKRRDRCKRSEMCNGGEEESCSSVRLSFLMEKHYKKVEEAYETLSRMFKCIEQELMQSMENPIEEVVLLFGATSVSPKEVYRIKIPSLRFGHSEIQHEGKRQLGNIFRELINSDELNTNLQKKNSPTNMFVMLKVRKGSTISSEWLLPKDNYRLSEHAQQVSFSFKCPSSNSCTCPNVIQFDTFTQKMTSLHLSDGSVVPCDELNSYIWFQTSQCLKGFRDCKAQGKSITDLWYKYRFIA